jgi:aldehyde:ferredoxin oxidoreductase
VEDDTLPDRFKTVPLEEMLREYYEIRGWDERGVPTEARLKRLELL